MTPKNEGFENCSLVIPFMIQMVLRLRAGLIARSALLDYRFAARTVPFAYIDSLAIMVAIIFGFLLAIMLAIML